MDKKAQSLETEALQAVHELQDVITEKLFSEDLLAAHLGKVETFLHINGMELLRRYLQAYLDNRSQKELRLKSIRNSQSITLTQCREGCQRAIESRFGTVTLRRKKYSLPKQESVFPLDAELNLPPDKYSHELRRLSAKELAKQSFDDVVEFVDTMTGGHIPKRQTQELAVKVSRDFDSYYEQRQYQEPEDTEDLLVLQTDGKGIVMHEVDLRPGTRAAAERARHANQAPARVSAGVKSNRKRMAQVASIHSQAAHVRTPEEIMAKADEAEDETAKKSKPPRPQNKRVFASVEKEQADVIGEVRAEAVRRDPDQRRPWVVLVDGAETQLELILYCIAECSFNAAVILDFIHVAEYVWRAARAFFGAGSPETETWVKDQLLKILHGQAKKVASAMRKRATQRDLSGAGLDMVTKSANYLVKYEKFLRYDQYLAAGYPIATGVIEGACRYLVKDRMEVTGARWRLKDAEAILKLRALRASGDFDDYWAFHLKQEQKRNYPSRSDDYDAAPAATDVAA
jgi:hypothetical protein